MKSEQYDGIFPKEEARLEEAVDNANDEKPTIDAEFAKYDIIKKTNKKIKNKK